ncbi:MAG: adenylate/guanylate cyclase domain-containing protein [Planctomycetes bacterium]|nr:adenylate/guanylate cyclase domain-containing protein [Planctomycetota bacterium]
MGDGNTVERAMSGLGSTMVRAGEKLRKARTEFGKAHEPRQRAVTALLACIAACAVTSLLLVQWDDAALIDYVELPSRDARVRTIETNEQRDPDILLINIDEAALAYGDSWQSAQDGSAAADRYAWPWPRHVYSKIIRYCREGGARVVVFDMIYSESGPNTNQAMLVREVNGNLTRMWTFDQAGDDLFAMEATAQDDVALALVLGATNRSKDVRDDLLPAYAGKLKGDGQPELLDSVADRYAKFRTAEAPYPALLDGWPSLVADGRSGAEGADKKLASLRKRINGDPWLNDSPRLRSLLPVASTPPQGVAGLGLVMGFEDIDGVLRRYDVVGAHDTRLYRTLPLETWRLFVLSYAREFTAAGRLEDFNSRFSGLVLTAQGLECDGVTYVLANELQDVPVSIEGDTASYLGRAMPLDGSSRVLLRYRGYLRPDQNADWNYLSPEQQQAVRDRHPNDRLFAVYPQLSATDILRDWDFLSDNRFKTAETQRLNALIPDLEKSLASAAEEDRDALQAQLSDARMRLKAVKSQQVHTLGLGEPSAIVKDKVVIIAATAIGLLDRHDTPLDSNTPGTWVLATFFDNLKNEDFMTESPRWLAWLLALFGAAFTVVTVLYAGQLRNGLVLTLLLAVLVLVAGWVAFEQQHFLPLAAPLAGLLFGFSHGALAKALTEGAQKRQRESFARQYMGRELVDYVIKNPGALKLGGENRAMSVFFSDVAGFTTVTETLGPNNPERLVELLNIYLERMTDLMLETGGVIDKYIGDAIMCFWGAPVDQADHAVRACRGALTCRAELQRMQPLFADSIRGIAPQLIKPDGTVLYARAGINSGLMTVGNMGSSKRFAYTVMGDAVNLAARLEPQCKEYGTDILIGQNTEKLIRGEFTTRAIDLIVVKGKSEPVEVFELIGGKDVPQFVADMLKHWNEGITLFRTRQFEQALASFRNAAHHETTQEEGELNPSRLYIRRCEELLKSPPPPEWNGVFVKKTK